MPLMPECNISHMAVGRQAPVLPVANGSALILSWPRACRMTFLIPQRGVPDVAESVHLCTYRRVDGTPTVARRGRWAYLVQARPVAAHSSGAASAVVSIRPVVCNTPVLSMTDSVGATHGLGPAGREAKGQRREAERHWWTARCSALTLSSRAPCAPLRVKEG